MEWNGKSSSSSGKHKVGFLNDDRRINVAQTKAKYQLFCVRDSNTLHNAGAQTITKLVNDAKSRGLICN
jgi:superfamily I DNA and/or RNA helicase|eukprot:scaffold656_cov271-Chaetoceros_neogracile.AAC.41